MTPDSRYLNRATPPHITTLVLIAGLSALSMNFFLPSLPAMTEWFHTDYAVVQLTLSAYILGTAAMQLVLGALSDRFGRRPVQLVCLSIFCLATILCLLAPTIETFLIARMLQTVVVSGVVLSRAIVRDIVPMEKAASMIGYVTMGMTLIPMIGPVLGGYLNDAFGWHATFVAILVCGLAVLAIVAADLGETNRFRAPTLTAQFSAWPILLKSQRFWGYTLTASFSTAMYYAFLGGAPYVGASLLQMTPSQLGYTFSIAGIGYVIGNFLSGRYATRIGISNMMLSGALVSVCGIVITTSLCFLIGISGWSFFAPTLVLGIANGLTLPSANAGIVSVQPHLAGSASGLGGAITFATGATLSWLTGLALSLTGSVFAMLAIMGLAGLASVLAALFIRHLDQADPAPGSVE